MGWGTSFSGHPVSFRHTRSIFCICSDVSEENSRFYTRRNRHRAGYHRPAARRSSQVLGTHNRRPHLRACRATGQYQGCILRLRGALPHGPGDYSQATINIRGATQNGNGNGRFESATVPNESILAWEHLTQAGFLTPAYVYNATESALTSPSNSSGVFLQIIYDGVYGSGTTAAPNPPRHNIKTSSQIPVHLLAELDRKIDDGMPNTGSFQFSRYQGNGAAAPADGDNALPACTSATTAAGMWNATNGSNNCGAASLL